MTTVLRLEDPGEADVAALAAVLVDCVGHGASVGFLAPLDPGDAEAWWRAALATPGTTTWAAYDDQGVVVGCVRLSPATMPNSLHRAEVSKLMVSSRARGAGVASLLMPTLEDAARSRGLTLLLLDTETGSPAQGFYERRGWQVVGTVPGYALDPHGRLSPTTILLRNL